MKRKKVLAKDIYSRMIMDRATRNGGAVKLEEAAEEIGTGRTYAWKILQDLVDRGLLERKGYGLYLLRKPS